MFSRKVALLSLLVLSLFAKDPLKKLEEEVFRANINTILVFTSQDGLNTGRYHFNSISMTMDIMHLPFLYHLHPHGSYNYFILGNAGYSRVYLREPNDESLLTHDNHVQTYTAGLGGGIRYFYNLHLSFLGGVEIIYSRAGISVKPKDPLGDALEDLFNANYNDNVTYKLMARMKYENRYKGYRPYCVLDLDAFDTKSSFTFKSLSQFKSQSSVLTLSTGIESPSLQNFGINYLTLEGYYHYNRLFGTIKDIVKFNDYNNVGAVLYYYTPGTPDFASRFFFEVNSVFSYGLEGYNAGVGFSMNF